MKTVAIIGAGPSGIVTAKTLLQSKTGQYKVRIFEKTAEIGGLWAVHKDRPYDGMLNPYMPTNLSRFNIGFSDLAWSSVGLNDGGHVEYWPKAWQVAQYLRAYVKKYIPMELFWFNTKVTNVNLVNDENTKTRRWRVRWQTATSDGCVKGEEGDFDHLVIATGLFGASSMPEFSEAENANVKVVHSTKLRQLEDVAPEDTKTSGTLLVVGGGMSGGDASTLLATHLSNALHSPSSDGKKYIGLKVVQLCPDKAYALPLAAPSNQTYPKAPDFLPLDLCMYQLGTRPSGPINLGFGKMDDHTIQRVHDAFYGIVGDQADLDSHLLAYHETKTAPYVTLTELYSGYVRSGDIQVVEGRLHALHEVSEAGKVSVTIRNGSMSEEIEDVVGIVYATGFTPHPSLDFLSPELQQVLLYDFNHNRLPVILDEYATISHTLPELAVVGFHEGAFWGSMEMEARLVTHRWNQLHLAQEQTEETNEASDVANEGSKSQRETLLDLRIAMNNRESDVPQYWLGDYVGLMETIAREVGIQRNDFDWPDRTGPVTTYRYIDNVNTSITDEQKHETQTALKEYLELLSESKTNAKFVSRATFLAMHGHWAISRRISSILPSMPSGTLSGEASFHPRFPTDPSYDFEYLYTENGTLTMNMSNATGSSTPMTMKATRQYVYRYRESTDRISVWFVKADGSRSVDYLYHTLEFRPDSIRWREKTGWFAKADDHLCVQDLYQSCYRFCFAGANISSFSIVHDVKGPKKCYMSETMYWRP